jgi:hypothetical protein
MGGGKAKATADPYGMTARKVKASAKASATADPYGMTTKKGKGNCKGKTTAVTRAGG